MPDVLSSERRGRITGSRIAGILGLSPYRNRANVMREMVREWHWADEEFTGNWATEWGKDHEAEAIEEYELATSRNLTYTGDFQRTFVDVERRLAVTPDGVLLRGEQLGVERYAGAVEIKCPFRAVYTHWSERPDYQQQKHLIAELLGLSAIDFAVWRTTGINISTMPHDETWWPSVKDELGRFLEEFDSIVASEALSAPYLVGREGERSDEEWSRAVAEYLDLTAELGRLQGSIGEVKSTLEGLAGAQTAKGAGLQLVYRRPSAGGAGSISYKKLAEFLAAKAGVELDEHLLDEFRGEPSKGGGRGTYAYKLYDEN